MLGDFSPWVVAWCAFALLCGGLIKGTLGVGTPLLTVPLMMLVLPPQMAVAMMAIPVVVANVWQAAQAREARRMAWRFWPAFAATLGATLVGATILSIIDERTLMLVVGATVISASVLQASNYRLQLAPHLERPAGAAFGLAAGLIGGVSSMFGPMLILYLGAVRDLDKADFVSAISFLYLAAVLPWAVVLYAYDILDERMLVLSLGATVPVTLGMLAGQRLRRRVSEDRFRKLVFFVLLASGATMLWRAFI